MFKSKLFERKESSQNVAVDGNFSVQVIQEALKTYGVEIKPLKKREAIKYLANEAEVNAFIFNSTTHWYSLRKIENSNKLLQSSSC